MDKSEPTPGPWIVNTDERFERGKPGLIWGKDGPGHGAVCELQPHYPREFNAADAHLIAASPDLYRELRHLVRLLEPVEDQLNVPGLATLNGARAALAKAEEK